MKGEKRKKISDFKIVLDENTNTTQAKRGKKHGGGPVQTDLSSIKKSWMIEIWEKEESNDQQRRRIRGGNLKKT